MKLSIIIPSYNEGQNVVDLTRRIQSALQNLQYDYEIWFIDDSNDHTPQVLASLAEQYSNVNYKHRVNERGLGSAVIEGFVHSNGDLIVVMDADLQHPPEIIPKIVEELSKDADIVIPSRFIPGGSDGGLKVFRKLVSLVARKIGQFAIKRFRNLSDCTSGYFGFHRKTIVGKNLDGFSWKILMEILMKGDYTTVKEIPYQFLARDAGVSKMNTREQLKYLLHIGKLVLGSSSDRRFYLFCIVGLIGLSVNLICFRFLLNQNIDLIIASVSASFIAMLNNYILHDRLTWRDKINTNARRHMTKLPQFILVSIVGIAITAAAVKLFVMANQSPLLGQLMGISIALFWNFSVNHFWTWRLGSVD